LHYEVTGTSCGWTQAATKDSIFVPSSSFHVGPLHSQEYFSMSPDQQKAVKTFMNMLIAEGIVDADEWQEISSWLFEDWRRGVVGSFLYI